MTLTFKRITYRYDINSLKFQTAVYSLNCGHCDLVSNFSNVKCQRKTFLCPQGDAECLYAPLSYSTNFITFPSKIRIPADLFTMRGPLSPYRRLTFDLKLINAEDPRNGQQRVGRAHFTVNQVNSQSTHSAVSGHLGS